MSEEFDLKNLDQYIGRQVKVLSAEHGGIHPTEYRKIVVGDILTIKAFKTVANFVAWEDYNGVTWEIYRKNVELIPVTPENVAVVASECTCVQLLFGHSFGCPFYKEY